MPPSPTPRERSSKLEHGDGYRRRRSSRLPRCSIITDVFPRVDRAKAIGIWAAVASDSPQPSSDQSSVVARLVNYFWGSVFLIYVSDRAHHARRSATTSCQQRSATFSVDSD